MDQRLDLTAVLQAAQSADASVRQQAELSLKQLETQPSVFLLSLSAELANNDKPNDTRRLAGLILKNTLDAKDEKKKVGSLLPSPSND
jgi:importin subunit beta-1